MKYKNYVCVLKMHYLKNEEGETGASSAVVVKILAHTTMFHLHHNEWDGGMGGSLLTLPLSGVVRVLV